MFLLLLISFIPFIQMNETLTFNFYGFSTELRNRRAIFNIKRCFKNDDDYVWATIGFNAGMVIIN